MGETLHAYSHMLKTFGSHGRTKGRAKKKIGHPIYDNCTTKTFCTTITTNVVKMRCEFKVQKMDGTASRTASTFREDTEVRAHVECMRFYGK